MKEITTIGLDLAKDVFQAHGVDAQGQRVLRRRLKRREVLEFFANLPACLVGMEACGGAHYWARKLRELGHEVKLMAPQFVRPYVKGNKHDPADAEAICEAVGRPSMRFVPVKNESQQAILSVHRARQGFTQARTAQANQIRGLLAEFGVVIPKGIGFVRSRVPQLLGELGERLPGVFLHLIEQLLGNLRTLDEEVRRLDASILAWHRQCDASRRLESVPGIGTITASALVGSIVDPAQFGCGRDASAWVGLVPAQHSTGGKEHLLGISKRGDKYLRTLLVHGARAVVAAALRKPPTPDTRWIHELVARRNRNIAAVAVANKNMRIAWALLARGERYDAAKLRIPLAA